MQRSFHLICIAFVAVQRLVVVAVGQGHLWTAKASRKWVQQPANAAKRKAGESGEIGVPPRTAPEKIKKNKNAKEEQMQKIGIKQQKLTNGGAQKGGGAKWVENGGRGRGHTCNAH